MSCLLARVLLLSVRNSPGGWFSGITPQGSVSRLANDRLRITSSSESMRSGGKLLNDDEAFSLPIGSMRSRHCAMFLQSLNVHPATL